MPEQEPQTLNLLNLLGEGRVSQTIVIIIAVFVILGIIHIRDLVRLF